jgi:hypothetical protein
VTLGSTPFASSIRCLWPHGALFCDKIDEVLVALGAQQPATDNGDQLNRNQTGKCSKSSKAVRISFLMVWVCWCLAVYQYWTMQ